MGILPLTVLRRLDATIAPTNDAVLAKDADLERQVLQNQAIVLERVAGVPHTARVQPARVRHHLHALGRERDLPTDPLAGHGRRLTVVPNWDLLSPDAQGCRAGIESNTGRSTANEGALE